MEADEILITKPGFMMIHNTRTAIGGDQHVCVTLPKQVARFQARREVLRDQPEERCRVEEAQGLDEK